jgi:hypothetical protein
MRSKGFIRKEKDKKQPKNNIYVKLINLFMTLKDLHKIVLRKIMN